MEGVHSSTAVQPEDPRRAVVEHALPTAHTVVGAVETGGGPPPGEGPGGGAGGEPGGGPGGGPGAGPPPDRSRGKHLKSHEQYSTVLLVALLLYCYRYCTVLY